jgi:hypothetical protein
MLCFVTKLFDRLPEITIVLQNNPLGALCLVVLASYAVVTFSLYIVLKSLR